jgi:CubicO group peptidase (beta-lactamase class C family)
MCIDDARRVVGDAIAARIFPAAAMEVGSSDAVLGEGALGTLAFDDDRPAADDTVFDLASLTKPIVTATLAMDLVARGAIDPGDRLTRAFAEWRGGDRDPVTVQDLLEHAAGLPARLLDAPPRSRREFEHEICAMPLEYPPRTMSIYSDLGFILLGFLVADRAGSPLDVAWTRLAARIVPGAAALTFGSSAGAAPTMPMEIDERRGRRLAGEVHDNYAAALGGVAGHAGLFGSAAAVGAFGRVMLRAARGSAPRPWTSGLVDRFLARSRVPGSSRALGWDTMLPTSSCGTRMSPSAFGHVGFTGTSLWIDPAADRYFVLLTNRACGGGTLDQMREVRRAFHDALLAPDRRTA